MIKRFVIFAAFLLTSSNALAAFIYADDFSVGDEVTYLTPNATLSWLSGTGNKSSSFIFGSSRFYHQHFGGTTNATTFDTFPGIWSEINGSPVPQVYAALEIDFATPVRSLGLKAENQTSSPFLVYLFGANGDFLELLTAGVTNTGLTPPDNSFGRIFDATYYWNFSADVGRVIIGGASDAGYIYALDVTQVPEPSSALLFLIGLGCIIKLRRR